jgi:hypothetical protein
MFTRPPQQTIKVAAAVYGQLTVNIREGDALHGENYRQARIWIVIDEDEDGSDEPVGHLIYAFNDSSRGGQPTWVEAGSVQRAMVRAVGGTQSWDVVLVDPIDDGPMSLRIVAAPCVCGAGAVGSAGPSGEAHYVDYVRADQYAFIQRS